MNGGDLKKAIRDMAMSNLTGRAAMSKPFMADVIRHPEYKPIPPEACQCGILSKTHQVTWKRCTRLGEVDGVFPFDHVRIGTKDYFTSAIGVRMCKKVK